MTNYVFDLIFSGQDNGPLEHENILHIISKSDLYPFFKITSR